MATMKKPMPMAKFEKSKKDKEMPGVKEGSKKDMMMDRKQAGYKSGGMVKGRKC